MPASCCSRCRAASAATSRAVLAISPARRRPDRVRGRRPAGSLDAVSRGSISGAPHGSVRYEMWHRLRRPVVRVAADLVHAPSLAVPPARKHPARRHRARHRVPADPAGHHSPRRALPHSGSRGRSTRRVADHRAVGVHSKRAGTRRLRARPVAGRAVRRRPAGAARSRRDRRDDRTRWCARCRTCSPSAPSSRARTSARSAMRSRNCAARSRARRSSSVGPRGWGNVSGLDRSFVRVLGEQPWRVVDALYRRAEVFCARVDVRGFRPACARGDGPGSADDRDHRLRDGGDSCAARECCSPPVTSTPASRPSIACSTTSTAATSFGARRAARAARARLGPLGRGARTRLRTRPHPRRIRRLPPCACSSTSRRCPPGRSGAGRVHDRDRARPRARGDVELHLLTRRADDARAGRRSRPARSCTPSHPTAGRPGSRGSRSAHPRSRAAMRPDVWHGPHYTMPLRASVPTVVTVHDLTFFDHPEWHERSKVVVLPPHDRARPRAAPTSSSASAAFTAAAAARPLSDRAASGRRAARRRPRAVQACARRHPT